MQLYVGAATSTAPPPADQRGQREESFGVGGILRVLGLAVGVYALSPGATAVGWAVIP